MKTRYKILLIIAISAIAYIFNHTVMYGICDYIINDDNIICFKLIMDTSIHITVQNEIVANENHVWPGLYDAEEGIFYETLKNNSGFIFWHMILPTFAILLIYQRDRLKK